MTNESTRIIQETFRKNVSESIPLDEGKSEPSIQDAEFMAAWMKATNELSNPTHLNRLSKETRKAFEKADMLRMVEHQRVAGFDSPYKIDRNYKVVTAK
jgi:hypothetical protein